MADPRFPFGAPSTPQDPRRATQPTGLFVLGVYPSALHVHWTPPAWASGLPGVKPIGALAISDEPTVFWDGIDPDPDDLVEAWKQQVGAISAGDDTTARAAAITRQLDALGIPWRSEAFTLDGKTGNNLIADLGGKADAPHLMSI